MQDKAFRRGVRFTSAPVPLSYSDFFSLCSFALVLSPSCSRHFLVLSQIWSLFLLLISFSLPGESQKMKSCEQATASECVRACAWVCRCASLGCSVNCPTDESIQAAQSVAFSRKPICCLIDLSKDKPMLYFGALNILKAVNSVKSRARWELRTERFNMWQHLLGTCRTWFLFKWFIDMHNSWFMKLNITMSLSQTVFLK